MKQDEFIKEFNEYFGTKESHLKVTLEVENEKFFNFINHLLSKQKPSVSDEEIKNKAEETYKHSIIEERAFQNGAKWALSLTPPDAEAVMFAEWIYKNYISNGIGKYYHNNWNGDLDTLVNYTTQELFTLYKQGGK